jgi:ABC-type multidrug transport system fused ATPase/permease subunit
MATSQSAEFYRKRSESFAAERDRLETKIRHLTNARMVLFLAGTICLLGAWDADGTLQRLLLLSGVICFVVFFVLVRATSRSKTRHRFLDELRRVNEDALRRLRRLWDELDDVDYGPPPGHAYAADLDLFGHASLFQLLGTAKTIPGRETLRDWLTAPAGRAQIHRRQQAVGELTPLVDHRNRLEAHGRLVGRERPLALHAFLEWTKGDDWILNKPALVWTVRLLPIVTIISFVSDISGIFDVPIWALSIGIGLFISLNTYTRMHSVFELVASGDVGLRRYAPVFEEIAAGKFESPLLEELLRVMEPAAKQMRHLDKIIAYAEFRYSGMLYVIVQMLLMWDHNVLFLLEKWRRSAGPYVHGWIDALGQLEALSALAALSHAHPDWTFPVIADGDEPTLVANDLGHPLIGPDRCVVNDVSIGPPGSFLFVTGSNMSGKSTLLRSVGVNAVLAQAGGPVYASKMCLPLVSVFTSMRVSDSLEQGISQYMAQLSRLKMIVDGAFDASKEQHLPQALFLLDEILQGTNSSERLVAVRRILHRLLEYEAIGAVTSHELTVPEVPELSSAAEIVHFRETAEQTADGVTLSFDYRLRPGLSTSTNALKLMKMVGLE